MRQRCENPNDKSFRYYGARGINVCERWQDFRLFAADMGERPTPHHTIERVDNDGHYDPFNCIWATRSANNKNRRLWRSGLDKRRPAAR